MDMYLHMFVFILSWLFFILFCNCLRCRLGQDSPEEEIMHLNGTFLVK